eukprot:CAMPEP_0174328494 /NCGR_PEP_ID=MMETSP0810-20121108/15177_1 /TAXON_ID=73025 ORGANISM="Eutreptiella gymnastica-like, Strain CCMP1594" /NCGR_SAMPLE_ID=MMETSP0810 /ASSEMBLY_ACC=CAM_ASM_000659 /LENGTH=105 /DNA_ID=CAMNT_0015442605 /DNA_START=37 /DNA_END=354 /DNA_ORIENTATION=+
MSRRRDDPRWTGADSLNDERKSIKNSERELDNIVGMGDAVMEALRGQRQKMERSSGSLESIAASLGISQSIVRNIQRTEWIDAKIVYGGMIITTLLLILLWWFKG